MLYHQEDSFLNSCTLVFNRETSSGGLSLSENSFKTYVENRLQRADDRELFLELMKVFEKEGKEGLRKYLLDLLSKLEES